MKLLIFSFSLLCFSCYAQDAKYSDPYQSAEIVGGIDSLNTYLSKLSLVEGCSAEDSESFVKVFINDKGMLKKSEIIISKCKKADSIALEIVKAMKFIPAKKNGKPYESSLIIPFRIGGNGE